jgi:hypothetical protein
MHSIAYLLRAPQFANHGPKEYKSIINEVRSMAEDLENVTEKYTLTPPTPRAECCGAAALGGCRIALIADQMPHGLGYRASLMAEVPYCPADLTYAPGTGFVPRLQ